MFICIHVFLYSCIVSGAVEAFVKSEKLSTGNEWKCDGCKKLVQVIDLIGYLGVHYLACVILFVCIDCFSQLKFN